ncbi:MAG: hypothetical protein ACFFG0_41260 [Candidatus Thorarchaeota archaeon]
MVEELDIILNIVQKLNLKHIDLSKYKRKLMEIKPNVKVNIFVDLKFSRRSMFEHEYIEGFSVRISNIEYMKSGFKEYFIEFNYIDPIQTGNRFYKTASYTTKIDRQKINRILESTDFKRLK